MEENMSPLLEAYEWEKMDPTERQDRWEQENLNELERTIPFEQQAQLTLVQDELERITSLEQQARLTLLQDELERITSFETQAQFTLVQDEIEQLQKIEIAQTIIEEEEERERERNNQQLMGLEQWEHIQFLLQQMAQPHTYHC